MELLNARGTTNEAIWKAKRKRRRKMSELEERRLEDLNIKPGLKLRFFSLRLEEAEIETKEDCGQACPG